MTILTKEKNLIELSKILSAFRDNKAYWARGMIKREEITSFRDLLFIMRHAKKIDSANNNWISGLKQVPIPDGL